MKYNVETKCVEMSAAELCLFSVGDGFFRRPIDDAALAEVAENTDGYIKELGVAKSFVFAARTVKMTAIADGYFEKKDGVRIDIVRSVTAKEFAKKPKEDFYAYAKCCAWLVCLRDGLDVIYVRGVCKNSESDEFKAYE